MASPWEKAHPRYAPKVERVVPAWDPQDYSQVFDASGVDHVPSFEASFFDGQAPSPPIAWTLFVTCVLSFAFTLVARAVGPFVFTPWGVPMLTACGLLFAGYVFARSRSGTEALFALFLLPLTIAACAFALVAIDSTPVRLLSLLLALFVAGVLVDSIGGHAVHWRLKDLAVGSSLRDKWLSWWSERFDATALRATAARTSSEADALSGSGRKLEALSRRIDAGYLLELASYSRAFLFLPLAGLLSLLPGSVITLTVVPLALALFWVGRAPLPASFRLVSFSFRQAFRIWFYFGIRGGLSADVWQPGAGEQSYRIILLALSLVLLSAALLPTTPYLAKLADAGTTPRELWHLVFRLLGEIFIPLLVMFSTAVAALARFLAQVEYAPFSKESVP